MDFWSSWVDFLVFIYGWQLAELLPLVAGIPVIVFSQPLKDWTCGWALQAAPWQPWLQRSIGSASKVPACSRARYLISVAMALRPGLAPGNSHHCHDWLMTWGSTTADAYVYEPPGSMGVGDS